MSNATEAGPPFDFGLLANFVHQVINPLNGVSGTLDNLIDGTIQKDRFQQRLRAARAQLEQSILLVRNLAFFSELSADAVASSSVTIRKTCVIPQIIIEAAMFFQELGLSKGIKIHLDDRETQYKVEGNLDLLRQVFMNIFDNAVKYGQKDSEVRVKPWIQKRTNSLLIRVAGRSVTIPLEERERIFELGYRGGAAREVLSSGTGLGLYICRMILDRVHSATISVERSSPAGESAFLLRFPTYFV